MAPALAAGVFLAGCGTTDTRIVGQYPGTGALQDWRTIANTNRPSRGEILKIVDLGRSDALSNHLVIVQSRELPHRHRTHDSTVTILRGKGTMTIGRETRHVCAGAVIFIPRGVVHHFTNESDPPTVGLVVYAPPFDGRDREIVTATGTETAPEQGSSADDSVAPPLEQSGSPPPVDEGAPGLSATPEAQAAPVPGEPADAGTGSALDGAGLPGSSPGAVLEGSPPAPMAPPP